jgi:hypothetical protein
MVYSIAVLNRNGKRKHKQGNVEKRKQRLKGKVHRVSYQNQTKTPSISETTLTADTKYMSKSTEIDKGERCAQQRKRLQMTGW